MKNISVIRLFLHSLYSVKSIAKYRFVGIGKTLQYVFFLTLLYFLPSIYLVLKAGKESSILIPGFDLDGGSLLIILPIYILFMYILNAGVIISKITILAALALLIAKLLKRKLPYRQSWRLTAFSITFAIFLFGFEPLINVKIPGAIFIDLFLSLSFIFASILQIPKPKRK